MYLNRLSRALSFKFRTKLPHGLLIYHSVKDRPKDFALYVIVESGQLKVIHLFGEQSTSLTVGQGLNRDEWRSVFVKIDVNGAKLIARVDEKQAETTLNVSEHYVNYGVSEVLTSVVFVGGEQNLFLYIKISSCFYYFISILLLGLNSEERLYGIKYIPESFVGCIRDIVLRSGESANDLLPIQPLIVNKHESVKKGCIDK
ncbi:hypothetical protein P5V15_000371 [Pogonomyrmex californicus]